MAAGESLTSNQQFTSDQLSDFNQLVSTDQQSAKRPYVKKTYEKVNKNTSSNKLILCIVKCPSNRKEALSSSNANLWKQAELTELNQFVKLKTFVLCYPPIGANIIRGQFVYTVKTYPITNEPIYKARYFGKELSTERRNRLSHFLRSHSYHRFTQNHRSTIQSQIITI